MYYIKHSKREVYLTIELDGLKPLSVTTENRITWATLFSLKSDAETVLNALRASHRMYNLYEVMWS